MIKEIEIYDNEIIIRDKDGKIIERFDADKPKIVDRRGLPF